MTDFITLLSEQTESLISYLKAIPAVQKNQVAMNQIDSFRDIGWTIWFCKDIKDKFYETPEKVLSQIIKQCKAEEKDFTVEQRKKFMNYIKGFVTLVAKYVT
jgi:hypothetical protein